MRNVLVTGGAGFIGSHLVDMLLELGSKVVVLDLLTYASNLDNLQDAQLSPHCTMIQGDICDTELVSSILHDNNIDIVLHLAAESHVDNSIANPGMFVQTNVTGTYSMLNACNQHWEHNNKPADFKFVHVSTDEVFGQLAENDPPFNESSHYQPNSPYSASKAASDHLVRAWYHTYKFPVIITNCSNNFGPRQHAEKLIPTVVRSALMGAKIPLYGTGLNVRDWLYVKDHCQGIILAAQRGCLGASYCFGGSNELANKDLVLQICRILDQIAPKPGYKYEQSIAYVTDRKGHDFRYAIDAGKARQELGWVRSTNFADNLSVTIKSLTRLGL